MVATIRVWRSGEGRWWGEVKDYSRTGEDGFLVHVTADFDTKAEALSGARCWAEAEGYQAIEVVE